MKQTIPMSSEELKEFVRLRATIGTAPISDFRKVDRSFGVRYVPTISMTIEHFDAIFERLRRAEEERDALRLSTEFGP